jgi:hypothetical protein
MAPRKDDASTESKRVSLAALAAAALAAGIPVPAHAALVNVPTVHPPRVIATSPKVPKANVPTTGTQRKPILQVVPLQVVPLAR